MKPREGEPQSDDTTAPVSRVRRALRRLTVVIAVVILGLIALAILTLPGQLLTGYYDHHCTTENEQPRKPSVGKFVHDLLCDAARQMKNA